MSSRRPSTTATVRFSRSWPDIPGSASPSTSPARSGNTWRRTSGACWDLVRELAGRGQLELLSGGFYEPVLSIIPEADRAGQVRMMNDFIRENFGQRPRGLWLTERVWEPHLPKSLAEAGIEYTLLDEEHFHYAGIRDLAHDLHHRGRRPDAQGLSHRQDAPLPHPVPLPRRRRRPSPGDPRRRRDGHPRRRRGEVRGLAGHPQVGLRRRLAPEVPGLYRGQGHPDDVLLRIPGREPPGRAGLPAARVVRGDDGMGPRTRRPGGLRQAQGRRPAGGPALPPRRVLQGLPAQVPGGEPPPQAHGHGLRRPPRGRGDRRRAAAPLPGPVQRPLLARRLRRALPASSPRGRLPSSPRGRETHGRSRGVVRARLRWGRTRGAGLPGRDVRPIGQAVVRRDHRRDRSSPRRAEHLQRPRPETRGLSQAGRRGRRRGGGGDGEEHPRDRQEAPAGSRRAPALRPVSPRLAHRSFFRPGHDPGRLSKARIRRTG